jgi:hypothetical protein
LKGGAAAHVRLHDAPPMDAGTAATAARRNSQQLALAAISPSGCASSMHAAPACCRIRVNQYNHIAPDRRIERVPSRASTAIPMDRATRLRTRPRETSSSVQSLPGLARCRFIGVSIMVSMQCYEILMTWDEISVRVSSPHMFKRWSRVRIGIGCVRLLDLALWSLYMEPYVSLTGTSFFVGAEHVEVQPTSTIRGPYQTNQRLYSDRRRTIAIRTDGPTGFISLPVAIP